MYTGIGICMAIVLAVSRFFEVCLLSLSLLARASRNSILYLENLKSNLMDSCYRFIAIPITKFFNSSFSPYPENIVM